MRFALHCWRECLHPPCPPWYVPLRQGLPRVYIKLIVELEAAVNAISKADAKKFSSSNAKAVNRMRGMLKDVTATHRASMDAYIAAPDVPEASAASGGAGGGGGGGKKAAVLDDSDSDDEIIIGRE